MNTLAFDTQARLDYELDDLADRTFRSLQILFTRKPLISR